MQPAATAMTQLPLNRLRLLVGEILLAALCIAALAAAQALYVEGTSMVPTLYLGQLLLINKDAYWRLDGTLLEQVLPDNPAGSPRYLFGGPHRGDVVVFRSPTSANYNVKRVVGLPGELLRVDAGRVFINGQPLDEPYVQFSDDYTVTRLMAGLAGCPRAPTSCLATTVR
jgi:signal peptidase I